MAGSIMFGDETWTAAGWLFDLVIRTLAEHVKSQTLTDELHLITRENLGALAVYDLDAGARQELLDVMSGNFLYFVTDKLPADSAGISRPAVIQHLWDLIAIARSATESS